MLFENPVLFTSFAVFCTLFIGYKYLKKRYILYTCIFITTILCGYSIYKIQQIHDTNIIGDYILLFVPLLFLIYYVIARKTFILIFKNEPIMAGHNAISWNQGEYRKLHWGDVLFTIILAAGPFFTAMLFINLYTE